MINTAQPTPFEANILEQPDALRRLASHLPDAAAEEVLQRRWGRVVLTGMGSSHFAGIPTWRSLADAGVPAWSVDTGQLLDTPGLIDADTLLIMTSQSGASGEIVALLELVDDQDHRPGAVVGVVDDESSRLARRSHLVLPLHSGPEATVSTKSYLNTLGVHHAVARTLLGRSNSELPEDLLRLADVVEQLIPAIDLSAFAATAVGASDRRVAMVGRSDDAATALLAALITKESSKIAAEGYVGGQFRHGPLELAGPGLTTVLFGVDESDAGQAMRRLAFDVIATGSHVLVVGSTPVPGAEFVQASRGPIEGLATGAVVAQLLAVEFARAAGVVPGEFAYGAKVTTAL